MSALNGWKEIEKEISRKFLLYRHFYSFPQIWFCWMNSWDEARSSCSAPQEGTTVQSFAEQSIIPYDDDDDLNLEEEEDENGIGSDGPILQGISSRGRIVRSRWNSRRSRR